MKITEKEFKRLYFSKTLEEMAEMFNCHWQTVRNRAKKLGLSKHHTGEKLEITKQGEK